MKIIAKVFEGNDNWEQTKLVSIHDKNLIEILRKISLFERHIIDIKHIITPCWRETDAVKLGYTKRNTKFPNFENYELIYSGPHFFVANPIYKTPRSSCKLNSDYDVIVPTEIGSDFLPRTNYVPFCDLVQFTGKFDGFNKSKNWIDYFKVINSQMLNPTGERTLQPAIIPPKVSHVNGGISTTFENEKDIIELAGLLSSTTLDFFVKTLGKPNLYEDTIKKFPLGISDQYKPSLFVRTLLLNSLNQYYAPLWENNYLESYRSEQWSKSDSRLKPFGTLTREWTWHTPLRNWYERRQALVEIDVITAKALGLNLDELILIYNVQFPVLQQNEDETYYDQRGNIVFTCSKGLTGVGVDRRVWDDIQHLPSGETYTHTIDPKKSELYGGTQITYYAPFDKCDRVEDYKLAWKTLTAVTDPVSG